MAKSNEILYSEIPYDDFSPTIKYRSSRKLLSSNNLVILFLFAIISIISFLFIYFLNSFNSFYNNKFDFIPLDQIAAENANSTLNRRDAYFDTNSQLYHLAQDDYKVIIDHNFQKLKDSSYCYSEGTNWNQSLIEGKCVCKPNYSLLDCGLNDRLLSGQLLRKQSNCHFKQNIVNIKRLNKPSRIVFAMPLYECAKRQCNKLIGELVKQYEYIVDLFIFVEILDSKQSNEAANTGLAYNHLNSSRDEKVHLYALSGDSANDDSIKTDNNQRSDKPSIELNKVMKVNAFTHPTSNQPTNQPTSQQINQNLNQTNQFKNVLYQTKTIDFENSDSKEIAAKIYGGLWKLVFNNVTNYRSNDLILLAPPFTKINDKFMNFFKFYTGYGEPIALVDNFYARTYTRTRLPKDIQEDLNDMRSAIMFTYQYAMSVCKFKFQNFSMDYCLNNPNLVSRFEENYWKVCKVTANALYN